MCANQRHIIAGTFGKKLMDIHTLAAYQLLHVFLHQCCLVLLYYIILLSSTNAQIVLRCTLTFK